jgi:fatty acid desaturase
MMSYVVSVNILVGLCSGKRIAYRYAPAWKSQRMFLGCRNTYYGVKKEEHNSAVAALEGSTLIDFPDWLHGLYLNIAYHHIHHLNMRVPCYNLKECHETLDPRFDSQTVSHLKAPVVFCC